MNSISFFGFYFSFAATRKQRALYDTYYMLNACILEVRIHSEQSNGNVYYNLTCIAR